MPSERNRVFDLLKFFAIFLVLWGHSIQHLHPQGYEENPLYITIYSFHMPLFMLIVGFFSGSVLRQSFAEMLRKKGLQLLVPALFVGVAWGLDCWLCREGESVAKEYLFALWFLKSAFICFVIYYVSWPLVRKFRHADAALIIISLAIAFLVHYFKAVDMMACFLAGVYVKRYYPQLASKSGIIAVSAGTVWLALLLIAPDFPDYPSRVEAATTLRGATIFITRHLYTITIGLAGSLLFIFLFERFLQGFAQGRTGQRLARWGEQTLGIYMLQTLVLEIGMAHLLNFDFVDRELFSFVIAPLFSAITLFICLGLIKLIERSRLFSALILGRKVTPRAAEAVSNSEVTPRKS